MTTFTLTSALTVGTISQPVSISSLQLTGFAFTSTPAIAPIGTGTMSVTLTDPTTGAQETVNYQDASVIAM